MSWTNYFDKIYVFNLRKRIDRLLDITEELEQFDIPFNLVTSIEDDNGAEGLRLTLENILKESIELGHEAILIFEDDCKFVVDKLTLDNTMEGAIKQLPEYWQILYLGGQCVEGFDRRQDANLLQVQKCYSTHAWAISLQGMKEILSLGLYAPIDNCLTDKIQKLQKTYITYPFLATQREGYSDIAKNDINWQPFLEPRYKQKLALLK